MNNWHYFLCIFRRSLDINKLHYSNIGSWRQCTPYYYVVATDKLSSVWSANSALQQSPCWLAPRQH